MALAVDAVFRQHGFESGYWAGHGIGLGLPNAQRWSAVIRLSSPSPVWPSRCTPTPWGPMDEEDLLSRTYLVGEGGAEPLSKFPLEWVQL